MKPRSEIAVCVLLLLVAIMGLRSSAANTLSENTFQDDRIRVAVPSSWIAKKLTVISGGAEHIPIYLGGVLSKGRKRIYLLTHYGQASGIVGGRFGEILEYVAPSIHTEDPWGCFDALKPSAAPITNLLTRVDLYLDSTVRLGNTYESCRNLHSPAQHLIWFGSYFSPRNTKYDFFLTFPLGQTQTDPDHQMAFTATIAANNADDLPAADDPELKRFLNEASAVISSITYR
jgi:hypothetical protein